MVLQYAIDKKFFYVIRHRGKLFTEYGYETREQAEEAKRIAMEKADLEFVVETIRVGADQTEIVFPGLSNKLKDVHKIITGKYPKPLVADLLMKNYTANIGCDSSIPNPALDTKESLKTKKIPRRKISGVITDGR